MRSRAALATASAAIAVAALLALLPEPEIVYSRQLTSIGCDKDRPAQRCYAWARVSIGNTGNVEQSVVRVRLPQAGAAWTVEARSSDLRATRKERREPRVERLEASDAVVYEIRPLPRNTVVDLNLHCLACAGEALRGMRASQISVEGEGRAREGDPRRVTLLDALGQLAAFLTPLR